MSDGPVIDTEALVAQFEGDRKLLVEVAELFLNDYARRLDAIRDGIDAGSARAVEAAAHTLKGAVSNFAAISARSAAAELERMGREGTLEGARAALARLEEEMRRLHGELRGLIDQAA